MLVRKHLRNQKNEKTKYLHHPVEQIEQSQFVDCKMSINCMLSLCSLFCYCRSLKFNNSVAMVQNMDSDVI